MPELPPIKSKKKSVAREITRRVPPQEREWVASPDFLKSDVWKRLAYDAREQNLKLYGNRCAACGCKGGINAKKLNVDHIYPRKHFPQLARVVENLQLLCSDCNKGKGNRYNTDWRQQPKASVEPKIVYKPTKEILERIPRIAPGWDSKELLSRYREWCKDKPIPDSPHGAFIGWVKRYTKGSPPG